jgi:predicted Zn-dependent protease
MSHAHFCLSRRRFLAGTAAAGALATLPGCMTTNVATGRTSFTGLASIDDDIAIGRREHPRMVQEFGGEYQDPRLRAYVARVGERLAMHTEYQQYPYRFTLLNSPIVNAFALPGGFVYLTRGLLALGMDEAEMAGVLAHELGHVTARHSAERIAATQVAQVGLLAGMLLGLPAQAAQIGQSLAGVAISGYSRRQEMESDTLGIRYMSRAGYDPDAMASFLGSLHVQSQLEAQALGLPPGTVDQYNMMSTHPRTVDRIREAQALAAVQRPPTPLRNRDQYLGSIDGMLFGDDPEQGIAFGRRFVHPVLRFEFTVPEGFRIQNDPSQVTAQHRSGAAILFDLAQIRRSPSMAAYIAQEWAGQAELRELQTIQVSGLEAATAWTEAQTDRGPMMARLVAVRRDRESAFRFLFLAPRQQASAMDRGFRETTNSFRALSPAEAARVRPMQLMVVAAQPGDRVDALSRTLPYGRQNPDWFRALNGLPPGAEPRPGQPIKVVVV